MKLITLPILVCIFLCSCDNRVTHADKIISVELATGSCFGDCQTTAVYIDSSLNYKFYGGETAFTLPPKVKPKMEGYFSANINRAFWDSLIIKLNEIHFQKLDTSYQHSVDDQSLELIIRYQNKVKHIKAQSASLPDSVGKVFYWIANSYKSMKLRPTRDTFKFEAMLDSLNALRFIKVPKDFRFHQPSLKEVK